MPEEEEEPELDDLAEEIGEIESVADMDIVAQMADEKNKAVTAAGGMTEITPDEMDAEETEEIALAADAEELFPEAEEEIAGVEAAKDSGKEDDQITGQMNLEDILSGWEGAPEEDGETGSDSRALRSSLQRMKTQMDSERNCQTKRQRIRKRSCRMKRRRIRKRSCQMKRQRIWKRR